MRTFIPGIFLSKLQYALPLFTTVWGLVEYAESEPNKISCSKDNMLRLQTLQRQAAQLLCPQELQTSLAPTIRILDHAGWLSVHPLGSYGIIKLALRIIKTGKPVFLAERLKCHKTSRKSKRKMQIPRCNLNLSYEGFVYQAISLINRLPQEVIDETRKTRQDNILFTWVRLNIQVKPAANRGWGGSVMH